MEGESPGIQLTEAAGLPAQEAAWLLATLRACATHLPVPVARAAISCVHDARMSQLHARFCGDASTTDVLTFAQNAPGAPVDCDIAICVDEARRRAEELGHTPAQELLLYALHGLLHACGHDDHDPAQYAAMHAMEDRILEAVGVGALFGPRGESGKAARQNGKEA